MLFRIHTSLNGLERLLLLINGAYRGNSGARRWTSEQHLVAGDRIHRDALVSLIQHPQSELIVGVEGMEGVEEGDVVSCIAIKQLTDAVEFGTFAVAPALQGLGYGAQLLDFAETHARRYGLPFQVCVVTQNTQLIRFYERRGYARTGALLPYPTDQNVGQPKCLDISLTQLVKPL
ncbi:MAG: GNAT family N-acetyltransferase [Pseudomonadota bacterium]|nr:GNAT family N-acetyltransferase [Pseudomonadota bacterium]